METVELAYEELGGHHQVPLLILHGFFASSRNWRKIAQKLADSFRVYSLDLRNHGGSPHHSLMDYPSMAADVLHFMDEHGLDTAHWLGHSMGGKIAMWLALNYPERMDKLIVADIAPKRYAHSFTHTIQTLIDLPVREMQNRKQADDWLAAAIPEPDYRQFLLQNLISTDGVYSWRIDLPVFMQMAPNIVAFPEIKNLTPCRDETLFIAGADSKYLEKQDISVLFPNARLAIIDNAGHWLHVQQPEVFVEMVEKFLQKR